MNGVAVDKVQAALEQIVATGAERGAQFAVYVDGRLVADIWAGTANALTGEPVTAETLFPVFSVSKGVAATAIHRLAEQGKLSYEIRISEVWPEFGVNGKETITLRHALEHTAGLPDLPKGLTFGQMLDWDMACAAVATMTPKWPPGTQYSYHAKTYGWLVGEVARRVDGRSFPEIVQDEIATPLGLNTLFIGLRGSGAHPLAWLEEDGVNLGAVLPDGDALASGVPMPHQMNNPAMQAACLPSSNGLMNARAVAKHYASLLPGGVDGVELLPPERVREATEWVIRPDTAGSPVTRGLGYHLVECPDGRGGRIRGFGHGGYGGSMGFASPDRGIAVGFTRNQLANESCWEALLAELMQEILRC